MSFLEILWIGCVFLGCFGWGASSARFVSELRSDQASMPVPMQVGGWVTVLLTFGFPFAVYPLGIDWTFWALSISISSFVVYLIWKVPDRRSTTEEQIAVSDAVTAALIGEETMGKMELIKDLLRSRASLFPIPPPPGYEPDALPAETLLSLPEATIATCVETYAQATAWVWMKPRFSRASRRIVPGSERWSPTFLS